MKLRAGLPAISTVAVAVLAVLGGGLVAITQHPVTSPAASAVPLRGDPAETPINLARLPVGRTPQLPYLAGRVIKGGAGGDIVVPGQEKILQAVRYGGSAFILLQTGSTGTELTRIDSIDGFVTERIPDVRSVVGSVTQDAVAYAKGSTVYWQGLGIDERRQLKRPQDWASTVLTVLGSTVYFVASAGRAAAKATLHSWDSATGKVTTLKGVVGSIVANHQGELVAIAPRRACSNLLELASGRELWQSCGYAVGGFTFDGRTVFGRSIPDAEDRSAWVAAALDARTGALKRRWTGVRFLAGIAEDDDHLLLTVDNGTGSRGAIIRCTIGGGTCELAAAQAGLRLLGAR
ncbi:hypothetical protein [Kribbella sp. NPDC023855]|uniref:hypothetical protein n=1 Tax=Kribbella sp. NPDC023855 TaxID=3154698 RepID=UPI0033EB1121